MKSQRKILQIELIAKTVFSVLYKVSKLPQGKLRKKKKKKKRTKDKCTQKKERKATQTLAIVLGKINRQVYNARVVNGFD